MARVVRFLMKSIFPIFLLFLAMLVGWFLYPHEEQRWAELSDLEAEWDVSTNRIWLRVEIDKHMDCVHTAVRKNLEPVVDQGILPRQIPLNGDLPSKFQSLPKGHHPVRDIASPRILPVTPGRYILSIVALCESLKSRDKSDDEGPSQFTVSNTVDGSKPLGPPSRPLLETAPIRVNLIVPRIEVRPIQRRTRRNQPTNRPEAQWP